LRGGGVVTSSINQKISLNKTNASLLSLSLLYTATILKFGEFDPE
jgi:hypothetical protein